MKLWKINSFTDQFFKGDSAAVCLVEEFPSDDVMQKIAQEMNLPETAFMKAKKNNHFKVRIFSTTSQLEVCGHSIMGCAHVLWEELKININPIYFEGVFGVLKARYNDGKITLDLPANKPKPVIAPEEVMDAFGSSVVCINKADEDCIIELRNREKVEGVGGVQSLEDVDYDGIILTSDGETKDLDFVSRFFDLSGNKSEEQVNLSSYCNLAPYWADRLGKSQMTASHNRDSIVSVCQRSNRIMLTGNSVTIMDGEILEIY